MSVQSTLTATTIVIMIIIIAEVSVCHVAYLPPSVAHGEHGSPQRHTFPCLILNYGWNGNQEIKGKYDDDSDSDADDNRIIAYRIISYRIVS